MDLFDGFSKALMAGDMVVLPLALAAGLIAGVNPCCLALYPAAAGACCSAQGQVKIRTAWNAAAFVLGIAVAGAALGLLAVYIGRVAAVGTPFKYAIAFLLILMGVYRLGWIRLPLRIPLTVRPGLSGAFGTGLLLALVIGPCGTPVLASLLSFVAYKQSFMYGGLLLFLYGVGNGLPLMLVGTTAGGMLKRLEGSRLANWIDPAVGVLLILLGFYLLWRI
jgi:cytochrome c biogenesis protein CcdA